MAAKTTTFFFLLFFSLNLQCSSSDNWIRAGYWHSGTALPVSEINSALFTHLMCAFVRINSSTYHIFIDSNYEQSFSNFTNTVKRKNPSVTTLLSIFGARQDSEIFFSMINQSSSRQSFIESSIETARLYGFDGINLAAAMPGNSTSMTNLGTLLEDWRVAIALESRNSGKSELLLVMTCYYYSATRLLSYLVESMKKSLDWVDVLAFDNYLPTRDNFTGPHSALYSSSSSSSWLNINNSVQEWLNRGFLAPKLVLCMPYHGYAWKLVNIHDNAVGAPASGPMITIDGSMGYKFIKAYIRDYGYGAASVYNGTFGVNFFTSDQTWINFDGVEAIRAKVSFAKEKGLLGYSVFQLVNDDNWELSTAAKDHGGKDQKNRRWLLIIILITVAMVILLIGTIVCYLKRKFILRSRMKNTASDTENLSCNGHNLLVLSFTTIREATDNFASGNKIGEGGYGPVYKGRLPNGQEVAVKRLSKLSHQGSEEFKNEVKLNARLQHVNLVPVLGICNEKEEKMLIYEFMPNKSLDFYIFDPIRRYLLDWGKRVHIIEGITQGLLYLQEYSNFTIIHRDLKSSNILLDSEMNPKISDFGLAKAFTKDECEANTGQIVGTYGYVPPEYVRKGIYSMKYDVYSFGVLLLQIISGKRTVCYYGLHDSLNLLEFAYKLWRDGEGMEFFDSSLDDSSSTWKLMRCMQVALLCVQENPADRPTMLEVYTLLKNETATITTPRKPAFSFTRDEDDESNKCNKCTSNLVRLLGFCLERKERILVYEFLPKSSLNHFLFDPIKRECLDWEKRYKIIGGIARGLLYLHEDSRLRIIHRDLKTSNVLLDSELNPKISDFGMATLFEMDHTQSDSSNRVVGTFGYMAPEYVMNGHISVKSDVYSYGTLVLEIMSGQKINSFGTEDETEGLLSYAWKNWNEGTASNLIDPTLKEGSRDEMMKCIHIGLLCVQENVSDRPTMASVVAYLNSTENRTLQAPSKPGFLLQISIIREASSSPREYYSGSTKSDQVKNEVVPLSRNDVTITELYPR